MAVAAPHDAYFSVSIVESSHLEFTYQALQVDTKDRCNIEILIDLLIASIVYKTEKSLAEGSIPSLAPIILIILP